LVRPGDSVALAALLERLRTYPAIAAEIVDHAERKARTQFSVDSMRAGVTAAVLEVTASGSRRADSRWGIKPIVRELAASASRRSAES
jgi:hypothetical protein